MEKVKFSTSNEYRGYFINSFSQMEMSIDLLLASYFIKSKRHQHELIEIIIDRLSFDSKRTALKFILDKKSDKDFLDGKHGNKKKNFKKLLEEIGKLSRVRNQFAHYSDFNTVVTSKEVMCLLQFRDSSNLIFISEITYHKYIEEIERCRNEIIAILDE